MLGPKLPLNSKEENSEDFRRGGAERRVSIPRAQAQRGRAGGGRSSAAESLRVESEYQARPISGLLRGAKGFRLPGRLGETSGKRVGRFRGEKGDKR